MSGFIKDPDATLDYSINWVPWLGDDTISLSEWEAQSGIEIVSGSEDETDGVTVVLVSGGVAGRDYKLTNSITTATGKQDDRTITIRVRQR